MSTITANTGSNNWNTNAAWVGAVQPTAADDAVIPSGAVVTIPSATTAVCRSCTNQSGGTIAFAATTSNLNIGTSTAGAGNVAFSNSGTITLTAIGTINLISTSATQQTIKTNGSIMPNITFNGVGSSYLQSDAITATGATLTASAGTWATGNFNVTCAFMSSGGSGVRVVTPGSSAITITGSTGWSSSGSNLSFTSNTAMLVFSNTSGPGFNTNGVNINFNGLSVVASANNPPTGNNGFSVNFTGGGTIANLAVATTIKTANMLITGPVTVTGTIAFQGNSATNRLLIQSNTLGTARTITCNGSTTASVTLAGTTYVSQWADFMDITGAGTASWDISAITGGSGDCQGNTGITFTTAAPQTYTDSGSHSDSWSTLARWTSRVPLPQDNVSVPLGSTGTITADMPRLGKNLDFTGYTGTLARTSTTNTHFGNLALAIGMTVTATQSWVFGGRGSQTVTSSGVQFGTSQTVQMAAPGGTYTQQDAFAIGGNATSAALQVRNGTWVSGGFSLMVPVFDSVGTATRTVTLTTSTVTLTSTSTVNIVTIQAAGLTLNATSATFVIAVASTNPRTVAGGGVTTYGNLQYTVSGSPGPLVVTGANTFANITVTTAGNAPKTLTLPSSTTTTVTNSLTCFLPGTRMMFESGLKRVEEAGQNESVYQVDGEFGEVIDRWSKPYNGDAVWVKARGMLDAGLTVDHKVLRVPGERVRRFKNRKKSWEWKYGGKYEDGKITYPSLNQGRSLDLTPEWVPAGDLNRGDFLLIPRPNLIECQVEIEFPSMPYSPYTRRVNSITGAQVPLDEEWAEIFGWWVAEGCVTRGKNGAPTGLKFSLNKATEIPVAERLVKLLKAKAGCSSSLQADRDCDRLAVVTCGTSIALFMEEHFGSGAANKRVPQWMLEARKPILRSFLKAYSDGDGSERIKSGHRSLRMSTISSQLVTGLFVGFSKLGVLPLLEEIEAEPATIDKPFNQQIAFVVELSATDVADAFAENVLPLDKSPGARSGLLYFMDENYFYASITGLRYEQYSGLVWDFSSKTETLGLPFIVHNCTGTQVSGSVLLPGMAGSYISTPNAAWNQITGDIDLRWYGILDNWGTTTLTSLIAKYIGGGGPQNAYWLQITSANKLELIWSANGTTDLNVQAAVTLASLSLSPTTAYWLRSTLAVATGTVSFYYSTDGVIWTQIGTSGSGTGGAATSIFASSQQVEIGSRDNGILNNLAGKTYKAQILNGIGGTVVASPDFTTTATGLETSYTDAQANLWTVNGAVNGLAYLNSSSAGTRATLSAGPSVGIWPVALATITDSNATGGATFSATQSTLNNDVGWTSPALQSATDIVGMSNGVSQAVKTSANF